MASGDQRPNARHSKETQMTTLRSLKTAAFAIAATLLTAGAALACPAGFIAVDSEGYRNAVDVSTHGEGEYVAIDQFGKRHHLKGVLRGNCLALVAGQYGKYNTAKFKIVGDNIAVGVIQAGDSDFETRAKGEDIVVAANLARGTDGSVIAEGTGINISINQR
jgi:hypothetical protein